MFVKPIMVDRVWGGNRLESLFGKALPAGKVIGESWELADRPGMQTTIVGGRFDGATLHQVMRDQPRLVLGEALAARNLTFFPLLVKIIDAGQDLSVQVHPDDKGCKKLGIDDRGKTECWVVIHADPGARMQRGLKPGVTRESFQKALDNGKIEDVLHYFPVQAGDVVAIPPGMVHAIGAGTVLAEIQQNSDTTFRVYDYNRAGLDGKPRPLHLKESLDTIRFDGPAKGFFKGDMKADKVTGRPVPFRKDGYLSPLLDGKYFNLTRWHIEPGKRFSTTRTGEAPTVMVFLSGEGTLGGRPVRPGQTVLLPAALEKVEVECNKDAPLEWLVSSPSAEA